MEVFLQNTLTSFTNCTPTQVISKSSIPLVFELISSISSSNSVSDSQLLTVQHSDSLVGPISLVGVFLLLIFDTLNTDQCIVAHCLVAGMEMNWLILDVREGEGSQHIPASLLCLTILSFLLKNKYNLRFHCVNYGKVSGYSSSAGPFSSLNNNLEHDSFSGDNSRTHY